MQRMTPTSTLILPGLFNSGPEHWQSYWEREDSACRRVRQDEWDAPRCADWVRALDAAVAAEPGPVVLAAHSAACALVAHWVHAARTAAPERLARVHGALLVAPADPQGAHFPPGPTGFAPMPLERLPFPSVVVASTDDVYVTLDQAGAYAAAWGSRFVAAGAAGHLNAASGLGRWPAGYALLTELRNAGDAASGAAAVS